MVLMGQHHHPLRVKVSAKWEINVYCGWIELNSYNYTNSPGISGTGLSWAIYAKPLDGAAQ